MTDKTKAEQALELWREWFVWDGDPTYMDEMYGDLRCFFCGEILLDKPYEHAPNCIFIRAKQLVDSLED